MSPRHDTALTPPATAPARPDERALVLRPDAVLVVIDVQQGFRDPVFGRRNNPDSEANIERLVRAWAGTARPTVRVRQASIQDLGRGAHGPLHPDAPGYAFEPFVEALTPDLDLVKNVHSAFHGDIDLDGWLREHGYGQVVICGIQTNLCCETTARIGGNLGYGVLFVHDATHTFDRSDPATGRIVTAEEAAAATRSSLVQGFAEVVSTAQVLGATRPLSAPGACAAIRAGAPTGNPGRPRAR